MASVTEAIRGDNGRILQLLLAVPASLNHRDLLTGFHLAVKTGKIQPVRQILQSVPLHFLEESVEYGGNLLKLAVDSNNAELCSVLLKAGYSANTPIAGSASLLHYAAQFGCEDSLCELLKANAHINTTDSRGCTPIVVAAKHCRRSLPVIKILLNARCDMHQVDNEGRTALHYCCHQALGVRLLLEAGAKPNIQDQDGNAAMHLASTEGFDNVVQCLLKYKANPDVTNRYGKTPLHYLAMKDHWVGVEAICQAGGDCEIVDKDGKTPLVYAVEHNRPAAVKALLRGNCRPEMPEDNQGLLLEKALELNLYGVAKLLVLAGCNIAPLYGWVESVREAERAAEEAARPTLMNPLPTAAAGESDEESDSDEDDISEQEALEWFEDWLHSPHSLQQLCRLHIRRYLGARLRCHHHHLPLPQALIDYVTLKEVEDHHIVGYCM